MIAGPLGVLLGLALVVQNEVPTVRPADLTTRADWVGRRIAVDATISEVVLIAEVPSYKVWIKYFSACYEMKLAEGLRCKVEVV